MATRELTFRVEVPIAVARAGAGTPTLPEAVAANIEFTLEPPGQAELSAKDRGSDVVRHFHFPRPAKSPAIRVISAALRAKPRLPRAYLNALPIEPT
jgi:predicted ATPase